MILDLDSGRYYSFDDTALAIWDLLQTPRTLAQLVEILTDTYEVSPEQCSGDVDRFFNQLLAKGLVRQAA
ncbi:PqqD family protein [Sphingomonas sp. LB-2]|uniref:PqqD family protein n=1 Tax=Sphingomonas caeni TaxID=2984949 RepID=UPI0022327250|nr:PqqD family protein [Sphingomonas caeni]MCW3848068.1 PqqD family protein [Sphingomonas caeni]